MRLNTPFLALAAALVLAGGAGAQDLGTMVQGTMPKANFIALASQIRSSFPGDPQLASSLAGYLDGGSRCFISGSYHYDPIEAVTAIGAYVVFGYHREGRRPGFTELSAHWVNGYAVLVGEWWQQSRMHGGSIPVPSIPLPEGGATPAISLPYGFAYADDHGACIYLFRATPQGFQPAGGTGMDFGDSRTNPNFLTSGRP